MGLFDFEGKKAIVTGAANGLGQGVARAFLDAGMQVVVVDLADASDSYACFGDRVRCLGADLTDTEKRETAFADALAFLGGELDVLVNAAGIQIRHPSEEFPVAHFEKVLDVNLTALFAMCQLAGRVMLKQGRGKIINFASMLSYFGGYTVPAYAASKGGVAQVTKALANEWAARGVHVNAVAPGYMDTVMNTALINDEGRNAEILARIPAGRWGTAEDVAGVVLFLASQASDYMHGAVIPVDGGYLGR